MPVRGQSINLKKKRSQNLKLNIEEYPRFISCKWAPISTLPPHSPPPHSPTTTRAMTSQLDALCDLAAQMYPDAAPQGEKKATTATPFFSAGAMDQAWTELWEGTPDDVARDTRCATPRDTPRDTPCATSCATSCATPCATSCATPDVPPRPRKKKRGAEKASRPSSAQEVDVEGDDGWVPVSCCPRKLRDYLPPPQRDGEDPALSEREARLANRSLFRGL